MADTLELPPPAGTPAEDAARARDGAGARALTDRVISVRGEDRVDWLSGMVTNDTKALAPGHSCYTVIVQVKGKCIADAWVFARAEDLLVVVPADTAEPIMEHFNNHIIMEDAEPVLLEGARVVNVSGRGARAVLPPDGRAVFATDRIGWEGVDVLLGAGGDEGALRDALARGAVTSVSEAGWESARLEAGFPRWGADFGTDNYVQEANITARAVSFRKGCYTGQEVVCRLEMRGHVRRQLISLVLDAPPPAHGTPVGGDAGAVTSSAHSSALGRSVALAMVKWDLARAGGAVDVGGRAATIVARPLS